MFGPLSDTVLRRGKPCCLFLKESDIYVLQMRLRSDAVPVHKGIPFENVFLLILVNIGILSDDIPVLRNEPCIVNWGWVDK